MDKGEVSFLSAYKNKARLYIGLFLSRHLSGLGTNYRAAVLHQNSGNPGIGIAQSKGREIIAELPLQTNPMLGNLAHQSWTAFIQKGDTSFPADSNRIDSDGIALRGGHAKPNLNLP
ncbi:MAG: hypothetical protein AAFN08_11535 [Cyanobacteria bacterium J06559_3]